MNKHQAKIEALQIAYDAVRLNGKEVFRHDSHYWDEKGQKKIEEALDKEIERLRVRLKLAKL